MDGSFVVTGGGRGVGRAIVERLLRVADAVVIVEAEPSALSWLDGHPDPARIQVVVGDAGLESVAERSAELAESMAPLAGWVNNAASFRDGSAKDATGSELAGLIARNLDLAVVGSATAVRCFLAAGRRGAIVNVSSHQAQRAVRAIRMRRSPRPGRGLRACALARRGAVRGRD